MPLTIENIDLKLSKEVEDRINAYETGRLTTKSIKDIFKQINSGL